MTNRIAIVSAYFPPHLGGVERFTSNLADNLAQQGNKVIVVTSKCGKEEIPPSELYDVIWVPSISLIGDRFPLILPTIKAKDTMDGILKRRFDMVIVNTRYYPICLFGCKIANKNGLRPIIIDHSSGPLAIGNPVLDFLIKHYERAATKRIKAFDPRFFSVSQKGAAWLKESGLNPEGIVPNSINASEYISCASYIKWREKLNLGKETLIVYAGRLIEEKGILKAISAFNEISGNSVHFAIAGNGPLAEKIKEISFKHKSVHYVGPLPPEDLSSLLGAANIFCFPSEYPEGLPTVLLEAAAHELGIVTSNCAGAKEIIPDSSYGIVLSDTKVDTIAKALCSMVDNPSYTKSCGKKVASHVKCNFSWEKTARKVATLIR